MGKGILFLAGYSEKVKDKVRLLHLLLKNSSTAVTGFFLHRENLGARLSRFSERLQPGADWGEKVARELVSDRPTQYTARGPLSTRRAAHSIAYTARCPFNASYVSTSQWPTWKNTHTLNIILDDYKEITSYMLFF